MDWNAVAPRNRCQSWLEVADEQSYDVVVPVGESLQVPDVPPWRHRADTLTPLFQT
jgi:hypothetical protein